MKALGIFAALTLSVVLALRAEDRFPPEHLTGAWEGECKVYLKQGGEPAHADTAWVKVNIIIAEDGMVEGRVGDAILTGGRCRRNRGWLGRKLKLKTDFIIDNGRLEGPVTGLDHRRTRKIKLPFNLKEGRFRGTLFMIPSWWQYPYPMLPRLELNKSV